MMRKALFAAACLVLLAAGGILPAWGASPSVVELFYERRWKEFDRILAARKAWTPQEACLAANAAWLRQDWEGAIRILERAHKSLPGNVLPYADLLRALGLERTGRTEEALRLAKSLWSSPTLPGELRYYVAYLRERLARPGETGPWAREMLRWADSDTGRRIQALSLILQSPGATAGDALALLDLRPLATEGIAFLKRPGMGSSPEAREALGIASALSGNFSEAVDLFESLTGEGNTPAGLSPKGRFWYALSLFRAKRGEEAVPLWEGLAREGGPYSASSIRRLGIASTGIESAKAALKRLAREDGPAAEGALYTLAVQEGTDVPPVEAAELLRRFPKGAAASRLRWKMGWKLWAAGDAAGAALAWEKALEGVPEGLERARLFFWLSRSARRTGDVLLAEKWEEKLTRLEPLSIYAWKVFPWGVPDLPAMKRTNWQRGQDPLETWGFVTYARLRLEKSGKGENLARASWLAAWSGDFAASVRLAERARPLLPKSLTRGAEFLSLLFPKAYPSEVQGAAGRFGVDPPLVWAVMRQESAFDPAAVSSAGAIGLMQLMPETAKDEASRLGLEKADPWEPRMNILLGTAHLARALQTFGTVEEALAAYNAGSGSVRKWGNRTGAIEEWVEEIPFPETNEYVRKVLGNYSIYKAFETRNSGGGQGGKEVRK